MNRPSTSTLMVQKLTYLQAVKRQQEQKSSLHSVSTKFIRSKYKDESSCDANTETAYNTRNGVINAAQHQRKAGSNGYCNILRQKQQIADLQAQETQIDRKVREAKWRHLEDSSHLSYSFADLCSTTFNTTPQLHDSRSPMARKTDGSRPELPSFMRREVGKCRCEDRAPCTCGKRRLMRRQDSTPIHSKIDGILTNCDIVVKEGKGCRVVMNEQLEEVRKAMQFFSRHAKVMMRNIKRSKSYDLRLKFQQATRVMFPQHRGDEHFLPLQIPEDVEIAAQSDPTFLPPL